jgi:hypothetical protein
VLPEPAKEVDELDVATDEEDAELGRAAEEIRRTSGLETETLSSSEPVLDERDEAYLLGPSRMLLERGGSVGEDMGVVKRDPDPERETVDERSRELEEATETAEEEPKLGGVGGGDRVFSAIVSAMGASSSSSSSSLLSSSGVVVRIGSAKRRGEKGRATREKRKKRWRRERKKSD